MSNTFRLFLFLSGLLVLQACESNKEEIIQNYGTGEISRRHTEIDGKKEGRMTEYYKDGSIKGELLFENDVQTGKTDYYYPSGKIKEVQYYQEGKIHGGDTVFYENGQPQFVRTFSLGKLDGYVRKWDTDGSLIYEAKFRNDTLAEVKGETVHADSMGRN